MVKSGCPEIGFTQGFALPFLKASAAAAATGERCTGELVQPDPHSSLLQGISSVSDLQSPEESSNRSRLCTPAESPCSWSGAAEPFSPCGFCYFNALMLQTGWACLVPLWFHSDNRCRSFMSSEACTTCVLLRCLVLTCGWFAGYRWRMAELNALPLKKIPMHRKSMRACSKFLYREEYNGKTTHFQSEVVQPR